MYVLPSPPPPSLPPVAAAAPPAPVASEECVVGDSSGCKCCTLTHALLLCPAVVNRNNWNSVETYGDTFAVTQDGVSVTVDRTDNPAGGWGMNLGFDCSIAPSAAAAAGVGRRSRRRWRRRRRRRRRAPPPVPAAGAGDVRPTGSRLNAAVKEWARRRVVGGGEARARVPGLGYEPGDDHRRRIVAMVQLPSTATSVGVGHEQGDEYAAVTFENAMQPLDWDMSKADASSTEAFNSELDWDTSKVTNDGHVRSTTPSPSTSRSRGIRAR